MAVKLLSITTEQCPKVRFVGKRYEKGPNWSEWWENDWFSVLEKRERAAINGDAFIGAVHIVDGMPEYWIGMFFPAETSVADGFDYIDMEPLTYAVCYLQDKENSSEFYTMDTHNLCLAELKALGMTRKEDDWCFERYNCPRFTTPDEQGNVILDYAISIENAEL